MKSWGKKENSMASLPLLSIIIPVYNAEKYLNRCIDSIISSTYSNLEIIMVDDGSKDQSGSICDEYSEKDNRCRVYHTNNRGQAAARNYGLRKASGDYITFVDDDDWVDNSMYEKLINTAIETVVDLYTDLYHPKAKVTKDVAAGAVVLSAINAIIVAYFLFFKDFSIFLFF